MATEEYVYLKIVYMRDSQSLVTVLAQMEGIKVAFMAASELS